MDPVKLEARKEAKRLQKENEKIEREKSQKPVKSITISIEWKKSRMWGANPHATAEVNFQDGTFLRQDGYTCSGCGYDKESTVIAEVFNTFLRYKLWQFGILKEWKTDEYKKEVPYGIYLPTENSNRCSFNGGIGTNCYCKIAEFIGGKFENVASGKTFDVFKYTDN